MKYLWIPMGRDNWILNGDGFYISYNPRAGISFRLFPFPPVVEETAEETAICVEKGDIHLFYTLNGDFREAYEAVVDEGLEACMKVFRENIDNVSKFSNV